jgi:hypothetical protein
MRPLLRWRDGDYKCKPGRADCNGNTARDADGCECPTPLCCANKCAAIRLNGIGETFCDCDSVGLTQRRRRWKRALPPEPPGA